MGQSQGGLAVAALGVDVGVRLDQHGDDRRVAVPGGADQRRETVLVRGVHRGPGGDQAAGGFGIAVDGGPHQGGDAVDGAGVGVGVDGKQHFDDLVAPAPGRVDERGLAVFVPRRDIGAAPEQQRRHLHMAGVGGPHERRFAVGVGALDLGAAPQQGARRIVVAGDDAEQQHRTVLGVAGVGVGAAVDEPLDFVGVAGAGGGDEPRVETAAAVGRRPALPAFPQLLDAPRLVLRLGGVAGRQHIAQQGGAGGGQRIAGLGGEVPPGPRLDRRGQLPLGRGQHIGEADLGVDEAFLGRGAIPADRLGRVPGHAEAELIERRELVLGFHIALLGIGLEFPGAGLRRHIAVLDVAAHARQAPAEIVADFRQALGAWGRRRGGPVGRRGLTARGLRHDHHGGGRLLRLDTLARRRAARRRRLDGRSDQQGQSEYGERHGQAVDRGGKVGPRPREIKVQTKARHDRPDPNRSPGPGTGYGRG